MPKRYLDLHRRTYPKTMKHHPFIFTITGHYVIPLVWHTWCFIIPRLRDRQQKKVSLLYFVSLIMVFPLVYCNFALNPEVCEASFFDDFTGHRLQWRFILLKSALWNLNA